MSSETLKMQGTTYQAELNEWIVFEKAAIELIHVVGRLWFDKSVELILFRNQLVDRSASEILNLHHYAKNVVKQPILVSDTLELAQAILTTDIAPSRIDIGKLASEWSTLKGNYSNKIDFINDKLKAHLGKNKRTLVPKDVVLYGFGRIGRLLARELIAQAGKGEQLRLKAVVIRKFSDQSDLTKRAELLRVDSVHGPFPGTVIEDHEKNALIVNGHTVYFIGADKPEDIDYTTYGIDNALLIDNTGVSRDRAGLSKHLKAKGISKVLLTAPGKGDIPNIVHGVNHTTCPKDETIFSAASCTTNAIVPILAVMDGKFGIDSGHIETIHSYTNDQNLLDNFHKKFRRGRSAAVNMVITETGADKAVSKVLPSLEGKLTGNAVRVPTPDVSLAILNLTLTKTSSRDEINEALRDAALKGNLVEQIQYSNSQELVSTDCIGNPCASIFDSPATIVSKNGKHAVLYIWYDNEYGYSRQCMRFAKHIADVIRLSYY